MKKLALALVCVFFALAGCQSDSSGKTFRYDISGPVDNLDPLFATGADARVILGNLMEGLLVQSATGEILPGVAERYTVSADALTYTFTLRQDAAWNDGTPVTAADFEYAFQRMFSFGSPFATNYSAIVHAEEVWEGRMSATLLGVRAEGDHTLTISLTQPDPFFLERLCDPAAAPCNKKLFDEAQGRFGLEPDYVPTNGPFYLYSWDNEKSLQLRQNEHYASDQPTVAGRVVFYIGRDAAAQFVDGKSDVALLAYDQVDNLESARATVTPVEKTVWCIVFNQNHSLWGNPLLRQGLAHTVDHQMVGDHLPIGFTPASVLVPGAMRIKDRSYRELAFAESPLAFDTNQGQRLFEMGLAAVGREQLPQSAIIYIPEAMASPLSIEVQQGWQKYLSAYINFTISTPRDIENRLRTGDYQMLVMPFTPASSDISSLLGAFMSDSGQNYFGYHNPRYDQLIEDARVQSTAEQAAEKYAQAEAMLLSDAVIIPLYFETTYLAVRDSVEDLQVSSFGDRISFKYARKDN